MSEYVLTIFLKILEQMKSLILYSNPFTVLQQQQHQVSHTFRTYV